MLDDRRPAGEGRLDGDGRACSPSTASSTRRASPHPRLEGRGRTDLARRVAGRQGRHRARPVGLARDDRAEGREDGRRADHRARPAASRRSSAVTRSASAPPARKPRRRGTSSPGRCPTRRRSRSSRRTRACRPAPTWPRTSTPRPIRGSCTINSLVAKGKTPYARNFNASFNDPQSPWLKTVRGALFGDADKALDRRQHRHHQVAAAGLKHGPTTLPAPRDRRTALRPRHGGPAQRRTPSDRRQAGAARCSARPTPRPTAVMVGLFFLVPLGARRLDVVAPLAVARRADAQLPGQLHRHRRQRTGRRRRSGSPLKYTLIMTVLLFVARVRAGAAGAAAPARRRVPPHRVLPADGRRLRQRVAAVPRPAQRRDRPGQRPAVLARR